MFNTNAQAHCGRRDVLLSKFLGRHLRVCGGVRMDNQTLNVCHVSKQRENL